MTIKEIEDFALKDSELPAKLTQTAGTAAIFATSCTVQRLFCW